MVVREALEPWTEGLALLDKAAGKRARSNRN